jgi:hypothetical protein
VQGPAGLELAHLQDLDEPERGAETAKGRELVGIDLCLVAHDDGYLLVVHLQAVFTPYVTAPALEGANGQWSWAGPLAQPASAAHA